MEAKVLIYRMEESRIQAVEALCRSLQITPVRVDAAQEKTPVGLLTGNADFRQLAAEAARAAAQADGAGAVDEEMIVMSALTKSQFDALLDGLRQSGVRIGLKAVETDVNRSWSGERLQTELKKEREAFRASGR